MFFRVLFFVGCCWGLLFKQQGYAQTQKIDSVLQTLQKLPQDTNRVNSYLYLGAVYQNSEVKKAEDYLQQGLLLALQLRYKKGEGLALYRKGLIAWRKNHFKIADSLNNTALQLFEKQKLTLEIIDCHTTAGSIQLSQGNYVEALKWYLKVLKNTEQLKDEVRLAILYNNIGLVYKNQNNFDEALIYFQKAFMINEKRQDVAMTISLNNMGLIEYERKNFQKAISFYQKALQFNEKKNNQRSIALNTNNIANAYLGLQLPNDALPYIRRSIAINQNLKQQNPLNYSSLAKAYNLLGKTDSALLYFHYALRLSNSANTRKLSQQIYRDLSIAHKNYHQLDSAWYYKDKETQLKDSLLSEESIAQIANLKNSYEIAQQQAKIALLEKDNEINQLRLYEQSLKSEKNANQISLLQKENELKEAAIRQRTTEIENQKINAEKQQAKIQLLTQQKELNKIENEKKQLIQNITFLVILFVFLGLIGLGIGYYQKRKANLLLANQKDEIVQKAQELQTANQVIEIKNHNILASINYAQRIQQAMLPLPSKFDDIFGKNNTFILFMPKDIVSGDFYWLHELDNGEVLIGVIDCTGHGVPGAFMSMIGNQLLFDIVEKQEITEVAEILNVLQQDIQKTLKQNTTNNHDGMDMVLCKIDQSKQKVYYAGAINPLYYIQNQELIEIKGNRLTIGGTQRVGEKFTQATLDIQIPTTLYLFTDGYKDQIGGARKEKIMASRFKKLLLTHHQKSMTEQKEALIEEFYEWKREGQQIQIDDVLVVGIRL